MVDFLLKVLTKAPVLLTKAPVLYSNRCVAMTAHLLHLN